jgi:hypothetical protein
MLRKVKVPLLEGLLRKSVKDLQTTCAICLKPVDEEHIVDTHDRVVKVLVRCHGQEELAEFELGTGWSDHELKRALSRKRWFWFQVEGV